MPWSIAVVFQALNNRDSCTNPEDKLCCHVAPHACKGGALITHLHTLTLTYQTLCDSVLIGIDWMLIMCLTYCRHSNRTLQNWIAYV